jgi:hypothetical protein
VASTELRKINRRSFLDRKLTAEPVLEKSVIKFEGQVLISVRRVYNHATLLE